MPSVLKEIKYHTQIIKDKILSKFSENTSKVKIQSWEKKGVIIEIKNERSSDLKEEVQVDEIQKQKPVTKR